MEQLNRLREAQITESKSVPASINIWTRLQFSSESIENTDIFKTKIE